MGINSSKCGKMTVTRKKQPLQCTYKINGLPINSVTQVKYLGVTMTSNLNWSAHIQSIVSAASKKLRFLKHRLKHCTSKTKLTAYTSLVRPVLEYADAVWDPHTKTDIKILEGVQRKALRFIYHAYGRQVSVSDLLNRSGLPTLESRRKQHRLKMLFNIIHNKTKLNFQSYMQYNTTRPTRNKHERTILMPRCRTKAYSCSFFPRTISEWNRLPSDITNLVSSESFLSAVSAHVSQ